LSIPEEGDFVMAKGRLAGTVQGVRSISDRFIPRSFAAHGRVCLTRQANVSSYARLAIGPPSRLLI